LTQINNADAAISRQYYNDNLLYTETETITGGVARQVSYTYDGDGNRETLGFPGYSFNCLYTGRNQLQNIQSGATTLATYEYDPAGNIEARILNNSTRTDYLYDTLDRVTWVTHALNGTTRQFNYGYDIVSGNRKYARRLGTPQGDVGDAFGYDLADQVSGVQLNVATPQNVDPVPRTITYDANGNRGWFSPYYPASSYETNDLNQYISRSIYYTGGPTTTSAAYDTKGNLTTGLDGSAYAYDAQNRLTSATKNGVTMQFKYDGLNRQVSRTVVGGITTYNVWDGWDLVEEVQASGNLQAMYVYGSSGLILSLNTWTPYWKYHYQDGSGSTSHIADTSGNLLEWYRYDLQGTPIVYNANNQIQTGGSNFGICHLFTGQQWYSELGLYDLRNRFYSPDIGRFLQPDPIGFGGDPTNLYRCCGNNPVNWSDPSGLADVTQQYQNFESDLPPFMNYPRVVVDARDLSGVDPFKDFVGGAVDWGNLGGVLDYLGGMDHGIAGHFAGLGDRGGFSIRSPLPPVPLTPPINAVTYGNYVPINPYTHQPIWFPPGTSLASNAAAAAQMNAFQYVYAVTHQWNYIVQGSEYEAFGNFNAGFTGRANGWFGFLLEIGAGGYQEFFTNVHDPSWGDVYSGPPWGDDPVDQYMIDWGVRYYNSGGR